MRGGDFQHGKRDTRLTKPRRIQDLTGNHFRMNRRADDAIQLHNDFIKKFGFQKFFPQQAIAFHSELIARVLGQKASALRKDFNDGARFLRRYSKTIGEFVKELEEAVRIKRRLFGNTGETIKVQKELAELRKRARPINSLLQRVERSGLRKGRTKMVP